MWKLSETGTLNELLSFLIGIVRILSTSGCSLKSKNLNLKVIFILLYSYFLPRMASLSVMHDLVQMLLLESYKHKHYDGDDCNDCY